MYTVYTGKIQGKAALQRKYAAGNSLTGVSIKINRAYCGAVIDSGLISLKSENTALTVSVSLS